MHSLFFFLKHIFDFERLQNYKLFESYTSKFEMHRHSSKPSRFDSYATDHRPIRPERFDSKTRNLRPDEDNNSKVSPNMGYDMNMRVWYLLCESFADKAPVCPRRSASPKRSTRKEEMPESSASSYLLSFTSTWPTWENLVRESLLRSIRLERTSKISTSHPQT